MKLPILATKLYIPPIRPDLLPRPQIVQKLEESTTFPLTLISASAGSGKTTALSEWVAKSNRSIAWVSLDSGDNDPAQFLSYLISALQTIHAEFGEEVLEMLEASQSDSFDVILINLINEITKFPNQFSLIFDDYHTITNVQTNELVVFLIEHKPPQMHLVFVSRINAPVLPVPITARKD